MRTFAAALASSALLFFSVGHVCAWQTIPDPVVGDPQPAATTSPQSLNDYINSSGEPLEISQLGIEVSDDSAKLDNVGSVSGAGVTGVSANGACAGILDDHHTSHMMVTGALVGAGLAAVVLFPPAVIPIIMLAHVRSSGVSVDLIIAVDGNRVRNTLDLVEAVQDIRKGDAVYLTIVRNRQRKHLVVHVQ
jgi:S1-C subfamily serine protease